MKATTLQTVSNFTEVNGLSVSQEDFYKVISGKRKFLKLNQILLERVLLSVKVDITGFNINN